MLSSAAAFPGGSTRVAAIIGDPVEHSLSPALHNAAYRALGLDWVYVALPVPVGCGADAVAAVRTLGLVGMSVTMPHKIAAAGAVDVLSPTAERLGVVNTVSVRGGELHGDSTDGDGLVRSLRQDHGWDPLDRRCVVLGAGGAARAVVLALAMSGAAEVIVVARHPAAAQGCAALAGGAGRTGEVGAVAGADLVVNATPVGMGRPAVVIAAAADADADAAALPLGVRAGDLGGGQLVVDLVYSPPRTPLLDLAARRGATVANGLGMLVHQAALQVETWTGRPAPLAAMAAAARAASADAISPTQQLPEVKSRHRPVDT